VRVPATNAYPLPQDLADPARIGALAEPLANGVHAVRLGTAGENTVEHAVVIGAGTIGLMCLQAGRHLGHPERARRRAARGTPGGGAGAGAHAAHESAPQAREALEEDTEGLALIS
jgi:D-arabinose 1-dehydrogenase-like Zn-dependent alcohol dehydrogenase